MSFGYHKLIPAKGIVEEVIDEVPDVRTLIIRVEGEYKVPEPGQFNEVYVHGVGEAPISISDVYDDGRIAHTIRAAGSVTQRMIDVSPGEVLGIRGPYGKGWPIDRLQGKNILIVAGGIGLAPLRPVIREIEKNRAKYGKLTLLYGARNPRFLLYKYEFSRYESIPHTEFLVTVDKPDAAWDGCVGVVTILLHRTEISPENTVALVCGPEIMMRFTVKELNKLGFRDNQIFLSLERRMRCGVGLCGHCQMGPYFVCKHGPVFPYWLIKKYFWVDEI
ncbi:MAG: Ni/Fe hydrogenase subunit gamma [Thermoprotei archaeon]|nr:MAG: Ni/Fe hydrogenase subunit gamma [Thermoprotei archaeon]